MTPPLTMRAAQPDAIARSATVVRTRFRNTFRRASRMKRITFSLRNVRGASTGSPGCASPRGRRPASWRLTDQTAVAQYHDAVREPDQLRIVRGVEEGRA